MSQCLPIAVHWASLVQLRWPTMHALVSVLHFMSGGHCASLMQPVSWICAQAWVLGLQYWPIAQSLSVLQPLFRPAVHLPLTHDSPWGQSWLATQTPPAEPLPDVQLAAKTITGARMTAHLRPEDLTLSWCQTPACAVTSANRRRFAYTLSNVPHSAVVTPRVCAPRFGL
jgi:hypothetical protein